MIPADCVVGYPREYGEMVLKYTLSKIATLTTSEEIAEIWKGNG